MIGCSKHRPKRLHRAALRVATAAGGGALAGPARSVRGGGGDAAPAAGGCEPASVLVDEATVCTVTVTDIVTRRVTPTGSVSFRADAAGDFAAGGRCVLTASVTAGTASCHESYSPSAVGSGIDVITASYSG